MSAAATSTVRASSTIDATNDPTANTPNTGESAGEIQRRINFLLAENAEYERRAALYRTAHEETESLSMYQPQTTEQAYRHLGFLLGAFPPAAYFTKAHIYSFEPGRGEIGLVLLTLIINLVCIAAGMGFGKVVGRQMEKHHRAPWTKMLVFSVLYALLWALVTGFAGGAVVFIIGGFVGPFLAAPVALAAFPAFAILLRLNERGLFIERKHLLPIAYGISLTISAFILGV